MYWVKPSGNDKLSTTDILYFQPGIVTILYAGMEQDGPFRVLGTVKRVVAFEQDR